MQYETLTKEPPCVITEIYDVLGESAFDHDFKHIEYDDRSFAARDGIPGLHTVRPPDLFKRFENDGFRQDPRRVPAGIRVV